MVAPRETKTKKIETYLGPTRLSIKKEDGSTIKVWTIFNIKDHVGNKIAEYLLKEEDREAEIIRLTKRK